MSKTLTIKTGEQRRAIDDKELFVQGCRILAAEGHAVGLAGQVSLRDGDSNRMFTLRLGVGLDEAEASAIVRVDDTLRPLDGGGNPNPGARFHAWIYRHRPDVKAIVHTHPPATSAFSMLGMPLPVAHMDACVFHDDCAYLPHWPGVPTGDDEGRLITETLGRCRRALLANHGCVCTGSSFEEAIYLAVFAERTARQCLDALAAGPLQPIDAAAAQEAHDFLLQPAIVEATFDYWARRLRAG
ncbi:MAG: aldolase [Burkholderiaceae bacterium]